MRSIDVSNMKDGSPAVAPATPTEQKCLKTNSYIGHSTPASLENGADDAWHKACNPLNPSRDALSGALCPIVQECPLLSFPASWGCLPPRESP
ncbi:hypothetical protein [Pseudomonas sp. SLFW]|uniref:hypothetical protein n=1 Tax=Pseudomonas sp. SLFW TaxID=2683259 RepID=UPI001412BE6D|nr:hypothetical protein [Pseudomonas sp. SLFW]NBB09184.1 hypothetical protein [Pseudomonas sp. SLFW]